MWMAGSSTLQYVSNNFFGISGVYGTLGTPASGNAPGGRVQGSTWTDQSGNLWLLAGQGFDSSADYGLLNDLWQFNPSTQLWAWMGGSSTLPDNSGTSGQPGIYGTLGTPAPGNIPGGRTGGSNWNDSSGNFWLFGGNGFDSAGMSGDLNDLWLFNPSTRQWTWEGGASTVNQPGVYGTLGSPAPANVPSARDSAGSATDSNGNFWLFGGQSQNSGYWLNDLWEFNPTTREWTWMAGSSTFICSGVGGPGQPGVYGTLGVPAAGNTPGCRYSATAWGDANGNFWIFGGYGRDSTGAFGDLNDLWEFNPSLREWAWMGGSSTLTCGNTCQPATYGTLGSPAPGNSPGSRHLANGWTDKNGNLWLFGGEGYGGGSVSYAASLYGYLNDLWEFSPSTGEWTWMGGSSAVQCLICGPPGVYGTLGSAAVGNTPGGRDAGGTWVDGSGNLWLLGGRGFDSASIWGYLNDLWVYRFATASAAKPNFSVAAGTYIPPQTVTISDATPGAAIYYTTDGSTPTTASAQYTSAILVSSTETLRAIALASGYLASSVASATYTITPPAATPTFSIPAGTYTSVQMVTITDATPGAAIYYTTNTTTPTTSSTPYTGSITVSSTETIEAVATASGYSPSATASATYTITLPIAAVSASSLSFGTQPLQTTSASQAVTLTNTGSSALTIASITASADFGETNNCGNNIAANGFCSINVTFTPTASGPLSGTLTVTDNSNGVADSTQSVSLSGTGTIPVAGVSPLSLTFSSQSVGTISASQPVILNNSGNSALIIGGIVASPNFGETNNCGGSVAASAFCTINVTFSPAAGGPLAGTLTITDNSNGMAGSVQTVNLGGTGIAVPVASLSSSSLSFGNQTVGTTSASQVITLRNTGNSALTITSMAASTNFGEANNCGTGVAANASCTISVTFTPTANGPLSGTLTITDNSNGVAGSMQTVTLSGSGTAPPVASLSAPSLSFGNQAVGTTSTSQTITLSNTGNSALAVSGIVASASFGETNNCGGSVAANAACTINITFTPAASGPLSGTVTATDNSNGVPGSTQTVNLTGTGTAPVAGVSPSTLTYAALAVNSTSSAQTVTLSNTGNAALAISGISASTNFAQTNNCGSSVAANGSCTISVTFTPTAGGSLAGTLTVTDNSNNAAGSTQTVSLSGTGQDFSFSIPSGSSSSASVAPGSLATYTLSVGSVGGLAGTVSFTCTGAPSQATCTVSPNPANPGTNVTVTVATTAPSVLALRRTPPPPRRPMPQPLPLAMLSACIIGSLLVRRWREGFPLRSTLAALLLAVMLAACGGGGGGGGGGGAPSNPGTPAGTYNLTVNATYTSGSTTVQHTMTLTLTVS